MNKSVSNKYDVVIIGGGTAGCSCAYNCAKLKLKTLLVEKNNFLGGLMTAGLVVPIMKSRVDNLNCDYYFKLIETAKKYNAQYTYIDKNDGWLNPEVLKIVLDDILTQEEVNNHLDILFESEVLKAKKTASCINSVVIKSRMLSIPISSTYFVDATGSAEFSNLCGAQFLCDNNTKQQNTLRFILGNVNIDKFCDFLDKLNDDWNITNTNRNDCFCNKNETHFTTACTRDTNRVWKLDKLLIQGVKEGLLEEIDRSYFQIFSVAGAPGCVAFNCPRIDNYRDNQFLASKELINARKAIWRIYYFVKKKFAGFENSIIINIASQTGIREEKRVKTRHIYTHSEIMNCKKAKNPVLKANYGIDIHSNEKKSSSLIETPNYELPLESLISAEIDNLFVIGKIIGADFQAQSALRVQNSCISMGEGIAKYIYKIHSKQF